MRGGFCSRRFCLVVWYVRGRGPGVLARHTSSLVSVRYLLPRLSKGATGLLPLWRISIQAPFGATYHNTAKTKGLVRARACSIYQLHVGTAVNQQTETRQQPASAAAWPSPPQPPLRLFVAANIGGEPVPVATPFL